MKPVKMNFSYAEKSLELFKKHFPDYQRLEKKQRYYEFEIKGKNSEGEEKRVSCFPCEECGEIFIEMWDYTNIPQIEIIDSVGV